MALRFLVIQGLLCTAVFATYQHRFSDPQPKTIFLSKANKYGNTVHKLTESRVSGTGGWDQIASSNQNRGELSFFTAYSKIFPEEDIGGWLDSKYIGGFTKRMRLCALRENNWGSPMYILTSRDCSLFAPSGKIWEEFIFYVADNNRKEHGTRRIYYASCQDPRSNYDFIKLSMTGQATCGRNSHINRGSFYAVIPGTACDSINTEDGTQVQYNYDTGRIVGARISCNVGYQLNGNKEISCSNNGRWSSRITQCSAIECGRPSITDPHMGLESEGPFHFGDWVKFTCESGYQVDPPEASANCNHAGSWIATQVKCKPVDCRYPGYPNHGETIARDGYELGAEIDFTCERGYRLDGADGAVCMNDGEWSHPVPSCIEVRCESLRPLENGIHTGSPSRYVMGESVTFQCNSGFSLVGNTTLTCNFDDRTGRGKWSSAAPVCSKISCTPPETPENGEIFGTDYSYGAQISFQCKLGFLPQQATVATCLRNGQWDATPPNCHVMQCRDPGTPEHATRRGNSFAYSASISYQCDMGYLRQGSETITCNENGRWTGSTPTCEPIDCDPIGAPMYGSKEGDTFSYDSIVTFSCFPGYELLGSNQTKCLSDGRWSDELPRCAACDVGFYKARPGTGKCQQCPERSSTTSEASTSKQHCICETDTHGQPGGPCRAVSCAVPAEPEHGFIVECGTENNDRCLFSCRPGYILQGSRSRTCGKDGWSGHLPACVACPPDYYKREEGTLSCTPCPQNSHTPEGTLGTSLDVCVCQPGFQRGRNGDCEDINECASGNGGCQDECENTPGSYVCNCNTGGYVVDTDGHKCKMIHTCNELSDPVSNGYTTCQYSQEENGWFCRIKCHPGYFFVSGTNNYVTCGNETNFEWSHKAVNSTATIPGCMEEFYTDVQLPVSTTYDSPFSCNSLEFDPDMMFESMRVQEFIGTLYQCLDSSASTRFCEVKNLSLTCEDSEDEGSKLTVSFEVLLKSKKEGAVHPSCDDGCKHQSLREMLGNAWNLTKEMEAMIMEKPVGVNVGGSSLRAIDPEEFKWGKPKLLCNESGRVHTRQRLCVPCDKGYYLPNRELDHCIPCPKGEFQDQQGQTTCKKCLPTTTTLTEGSSHAAMCNVKFSGYEINTAETGNQLNHGIEDEDEEADEIVRALLF